MKVVWNAMTLFAAFVKQTWAVAEDFKWSVGTTSMPLTQYVAHVNHIPLHISKSCDVDTIANTGQI